MKVKEMRERYGQLENVQMAVKQLDSLYEKKVISNQQTSTNGLYYQYKDSIEKLKKENELTQIEAADEQQRLTWAALEKEEAKAKRN